MFTRTAVDSVATRPTSHVNVSAHPRQGRQTIRSVFHAIPRDNNIGIVERIKMSIFYRDQLLQIGHETGAVRAIQKREQQLRCITMEHSLLNNSMIGREPPNNITSRTPQAYSTGAACWITSLNTSLPQKVTTEAQSKTLMSFNDKINQKESEYLTSNDRCNEVFPREKPGPPNLNTDEDSKTTVIAKGNASSNETFPCKLARMLNKAEEDGNSHILSFTPSGRAFKIHNHSEFAAKIMPKFFATCRLSSFQRQLSLYGFRRVQDGPDKGAYHHEFLIKGNIALCRNMKRQKSSSKPKLVNRSQLRSSSDLTTERKGNVRHVLAGPMGLGRHSVLPLIPAKASNHGLSVVVSAIYAFQ